MTKFIFVFCFLFQALAFAAPNTTDLFTMASAQTVTGGATAKSPLRAACTFQAVGTVSASTGSTTLNIEGSNDGTNWITLGSIALSLTTAAATDGFGSLVPWYYLRSNITAISGTNASVTVTGACK